MRTKFLGLLGGLLLISFLQLQAQNRPSVQERVGAVHERFVASNIDKSKLDQVKNIFTDFYTAQDQIRQNIQGPSSGLAQGFAGQDFQSVRQQNENIITKRDEQLNRLLSTDEYRKWKEEIEPSLKNTRMRRN